MSSLAKAIRIASAAFEAKTDKGGKPYILHCLQVMHALHTTDEELMTIAVFHDLIEDTGWTLTQLYDEGFSHRVVSGVDCLTHHEDEDYDTYIRRIATNEDARKVKREDLRTNSDITRMKGLREKDFRRLEKYHKAFAFLSD